MKVVVATFNQKKVLLGAFTVFVKLRVSQRFVASSNLESGVAAAGLHQRQRHLLLLELEAAVELVLAPARHPAPHSRPVAEQVR